MVGVEWGQPKSFCVAPTVVNTAFSEANLHLQRGWVASETRAGSDLGSLQVFGGPFYAGGLR